MLDNSLGLNYNHLRPIVGNTLVHIRVLTSTDMVVVHHGGHYIKIPGVAYFLPTPMPMHFSVENGQLHYVAHEGDATSHQEGSEPEQVDEEGLTTNKEEEKPQQDYTTYADLNYLYGSIHDMRNHASSLRGTTANLNMDFSK
ncbi:hypothetical protein D1007_24367 [Hordeum vulgare]|nr:hypothetical protein D1007_24367 [Hordeum vulgare]